MYKYCYIHGSKFNLRCCIKICQNNRAGEIIINSIEHDGLMQGYNYELISRLSKDLNIPIIAAGGAESYDHFYKAYINEASTFATSSMYHFTPNTTAKTKKFLKKKKYQ